MKNDLTPAEKLAYSTVRIEVEYPDGKTGTGTGFFYKASEKKEDKTEIPVLVTNKHVVAGAIKGRFRLTLRRSDGGPDRRQHSSFELDNFQSRWIPHPDGITDLCVMPIGPLLNDGIAKGKPIFFTSLDPALIPSEADVEDLIGLESVVMVGYPAGIWDQVNNMPLFRRGMMATNYAHDWNGKAEFLIDAACFPGSSGSPVLLFDIGSYQSRSGITIGSARIKLLGVLYAGPQYTVTGEIIIINVPTANVPIPVAVSQIPNNLGIIIKAKKLDDFRPIIESLIPKK